MIILPTRLFSSDKFSKRADQCASVPTGGDHSNKLGELFRHMYTMILKSNKLYRWVDIVHRGCPGQQQEHTVLRWEWSSSNCRQLREDETAS